MAREIKVTQEGYDRLQRTLKQEYRRLEEATKILGDLMGAADEVEDIGLEDAKQEKARIEQRIDQLQDQLNRASIISEKDPDIADLGSVVTLEENQEDTFEVQLVSPVEAEVTTDEIPRISDESPLGRALKGRKLGDSFQVTINSRTNDYVIKEIR